jgi:hypothetical protein
MTFPENLEVFFLDFGQDVLVGPEGEQTTIRAIFDNAHHHADDGLASFSTVSPRLTCKSSDAVAMPQGTRVALEVRGVETVYRVADLHPDGTGITEVQLHRL